MAWVMSVRKAGPVGGWPAEGHAGRMRGEMARQQCPPCAVADPGPASPHLTWCFPGSSSEGMEAGMKQNSRFYCSNHLSSEKEIKEQQGNIWHDSVFHYRVQSDG